MTTETEKLFEALNNSESQKIHRVLAKDEEAHHIELDYVVCPDCRKIMRIEK